MAEKTEMRKLIDEIANMVCDKIADLSEDQLNQMLLELDQLTDTNCWWIVKEMEPGLRGLIKGLRPVPQNPGDGESEE